MMKTALYCLGLCEVNTFKLNPLFIYLLEIRAPF